MATRQTVLIAGATGNIGGGAATNVMGPFHAALGQRLWEELERLVQPT